MTEIDFALNQASDTDKIELVGTVLWNKANDISCFTELTEAEQTFVYIDIFESEINNKGLFGFFYNASGKYAHEALQAFVNINAEITAEVIDKSIRIFKQLPVSKDIIERRTQISELKESDLNLWSDLEHGLIDNNEDIVSLLLTYIKKNKSDFEY